MNNGKNRRLRICSSMAFGAILDRRIHSFSALKGLKVCPTPILNLNRMLLLEIALSVGYRVDEIFSVDI